MAAMELEEKLAPFVTVLVAIMVVSTFQQFGLVVIAAEIIEELGISRWQIGLLGAANSGVGAVLAPRLGRFTDQLGAKRSAAIIFAMSGIGLIITGIGNAYWVLIVGSLISGLPQGWGNATTNKLIANRASLDKPGFVTGFKQSGVQLSAFLSGLVMPLFVRTVDWHVGLVIAGAVTLVLGVGAWFVLQADEPTAAVAQQVASRGPLPIFVYQVAAYALLMGLASGGIGRFLPLFAREELGFTLGLAGALVAFQGALGIAARLFWGKATESRLPVRQSLFGLSIGGVAVFALMLMATSVGGWLLWPATALMAFTTSAWNVVAMMAVLRSVPAADAGRATGVVMLTFLSGITISAPAVGWLIDFTGSYQVGWFILLVLSAAGALSVSREARARTVDGKKPAPVRKA